MTELIFLNALPRKAVAAASFYVFPSNPNAFLKV